MDKLGLLKKSIVGLILGLALSSNQSYAAKVVLDFERIGDFAAINDFYNFGTDSNGNTGTDYGVAFSNAAFGIIDSNVNFNFHGNFANTPSGDTALIFLEGGSAIMNVEMGFDSSISFFYSSSANATVKIYDGLNGTGNLLASVNLISNFQNNNCFDPITQPDAFCHWDPTGVYFRGKAKSVVFTGPRTATLYDNITLGTDDKNECKGRRFFRFFKGKWNSENDNDDSNRCNPVPKVWRYFRKNRYNHHIWYR